MQKARECTRSSKLQSAIEQDTSFESICTVCLEFKSSNLTSNIDTLPLSAVKKYCYRTAKTKELDGTFSICKTCKESIKRKQIPPKAQRDLFQISKFPDSFLKRVEETIRNPNVKLNKVEQFLLKLVIPFIRVAHCERGTQTKVRGNLILISADIASSLSKILPLSQPIVPIQFKRKLAYSGHYLAEYIDKRKVELYFNWFKKNNPLFEDISLDKKLLDKFEKDLREDSDAIFQHQSKQNTQLDDVVVEEDLDDQSDEEIDRLLPDEGPLPVGDGVETSQEPDEVPIWQQHSTVMSHKYAVPVDLPTEANKFASLIVCLEKDGVLKKDDTVEEELDDMTDYVVDNINMKCRVKDQVMSMSSSSEEEDQEEINKETEVQESMILESATKHRRRALDRISTISVAPGEKGEFKNWKGDVWLEEKAFPHLYPYGTGGYLSSCLSSKKNMGFAVYCRNRLRSVDPKFRNDQVYIFFLLLVKELVELKRCENIFLRQARNTVGLRKKDMKPIRYQNLERYNRSFSVFKNMRGTASYYQAAKGEIPAFCGRFL